MNKLASQIDSLNKHLIGSLHTSYPFGLAHGKMGLLIYLYHLYDYTQEAIYKEKAERLLDDLLENDLSKNAELTVEEGLCGVALGLDYIVKRSWFSEIWNLGIPCLNSSISYITFIKGWKSRQTIMSVSLSRA